MLSRSYDDRKILQQIKHFFRKKMFRRQVEKACKKKNNMKFFVKHLRKCIKKMDFLFIFLVFCINIIREYVNLNIFYAQIL